MFNKHSYSRSSAKQMRILVCREEVRKQTCYPSSWLGLMLIMQLVLRDVEERGRDIEGVIKQWFAFVKPNFESYVEPQRKVAGTAIFASPIFDLSRADYHSDII